MSRSPNKTSSSPDLRTMASEADPGVPGRKRKQPECVFTDNLNVLASELRATLKSFRGNVDSSLAAINSSIAGMKSDLELLTTHTTEIRNDINVLRAEQEAFKRQMIALDIGNKDLTQRIDSLEGSLQLTSSQCDEFMKKISTLEGRFTSAERDDSLVAELEGKIDTLEQQARACNIEVCNVPERRGENLITLIASIGEKIKFPITQNDIISIHRVPQKILNKDRPKNIVVRFSSVPFRDNVLSAYRLAKGLKSDQIGIAGTSHTIYMNEHLTLKKKLFFRECRLEANKHKFKHCWVKHSTILVRRTDMSTILAIRNNNDFQKFKVTDGTTTKHIV